MSKAPRRHQHVSTSTTSCIKTGRRSRTTAVASSTVSVSLAMPGVSGSGDFETVPPSYVAEKLTELGSTFYNSPIGANCKLLVESEDGSVKQYWGHEIFLVWKSGYFRNIFHKLHESAAAENEAKRARNNSDDEVDEATTWPVICLKISKARSANFDEMLRWIYTSDDDRWLSSFRMQNFRDILINVRHLGLGADAVAVCKKFVISSSSLPRGCE